MGEVREGVGVGEGGEGRGGVVNMIDGRLHQQFIIQKASGKNYPDPKKPKGKLTLGCSQCWIVTP